MLIIQEAVPKHLRPAQHIRAPVQETQPSLYFKELKTQGNEMQEIAVIDEQFEENKRHKGDRLTTEVFSQDVAVAKAKGGGISDIEDPCQLSKKGLWLVEMGTNSEVYFKNIMFNKYLAVALEARRPVVTLQDHITLQCSW